MDARRHKPRIPPGYDVYDFRIGVSTQQCQEGPERTLTKGCDSDAFCQWLRKRGIKACLPPRANRHQKRSYSKPTYRKRHLVENFFERIRNFRRVATR